MELLKPFRNLRFPITVLRRAVSVLEALPSKKEQGQYSTLQLSSGDETWYYEDPAEFFAGYSEADDASFGYDVPLKSQYWSCKLRFIFDSGSTRVSVSSELRSEVLAVMNIFNESIDEATSTKDERSSSERKTHRAEKAFTIFIGHGHSPDWQQLRDHLREKHEYDIVTFEAGARAGHHIRDILEELLDQSSLAFLVLTGEDETADGRLRARQNVIHEAGLFQGRLGFAKAVVLLEEGVEGFSNNLATTAGAPGLNR